MWITFKGDFMDINDSFEKEIKRFHEHDKLSEELYVSMKEVFDRSVLKNKNSITMTGGLKDIADAAKALSSIRGDSITATSHAFNAKMKVAEFDLRKQRSEEDDDSAGATAIMRQLTEIMHSNRRVNQTNEDYDVNTSKNGKDQLKQRISKEMNSGKIKINKNEKSMKYDLVGVRYKYDPRMNKMVAVDKDNSIIFDYPDERIPEEFRLKSIKDGTPVDTCGREIEQYEG